MATAHESLTGRTLGDFTVCDQIGEGGFGVVYRAEQRLLGREAVIKVARTASEEYVARFLREARLASKLDHPYAAHIYAFGSEEDGTLWTAMEIVRGTPLDQLIENQGPLRLERFVGLFDKLCEVVHTAHEQGIIHRDLKPANVMVLTRAGRLLPKLLDLGIAKGEDADPVASAAGSDIRITASAPPATPLTTSAKHTRVGRQLGSPAYMAPEQWVNASKVDARTDIYALGILAYEALTGKLPFSGGTVREIMVMHARKAVPPLGGELPAALDQVIAKAMAKKPAERYASSLELAAAFREAAGLEPRAIKLPEIDPLLREELVTGAPQPLAEAVAALDGVRNAHQAQGALFGVARVVVRMLGGIALAAHAVHDKAPQPAELVTLLRTMRATGLTDEQWLQLIRLANTSMLPELVPSEIDADLEALVVDKAWFDQHLGASEEAMLEELGRATQKLERVLRKLTWLVHYPMVSLDASERWMGIRRPARQACTIRGGKPQTTDQTELALVDGDGAFVLSLWPMFQVAAPAPGHPAEVFVLDGGNRDGARMISLPTGFEKTDDALWTWLDDRLAIATASAESHTDSKPPYRGLSTFTPDDASQFVGRERETEMFANRLRVTPLLVVVGASGAGKSSFVQAGVIPSLGGQWTTVIARPGTSPVATLHAVLRDAGIAAASFDDLPDAIRAWTRETKRSLFLYIDQFEELFTLCHDQAERERYAGMLVRAARDPDDPVRVVMTVRDDFLLRCQQVNVLRERLVHGLQLLATPSSTDLERILIEPARRAGYEFEDAELPAKMVAEVAAMAAALPLLSFTASQMWEFRDQVNRKLTRKAYETLGGVGGALAQHAEKVFGRMSADEQRIVRIAFRNLVTADGTRAVLTRAELLEVLGNAATAESMLEKLIHARLLTASEGVGGDRVEVVHEALLSAWPRLIDWRREDAEGARLRDQLRVAARQWNERDRPRGLLWRGDALAEYRLWRARHPGQLIATELAFAEASEKEAHRLRRLRNGIVASILTILTVGIVVALVLYRDAEAQRRDADAQRVRAVTSEKETESLVISNYVAQGQRAAVTGDSSRALVFLEAARRGGASGPTVDIPLAEARRGIMTERAAYHGHSGNVRAIAVRSDGKRFASGGFDHILNFWDTATPKPAVRDARSTASIYTLASSPDDRWLASASTDGKVRLYDFATGKLAHTWQLGEGVIFTVEFTRDSKRLVASTENNDVALWDVTSGAVIKQWKAEGDTVNLGDLSPDGALLALPSYDHQVRLWNPATGKLVRAIGPHADTIWHASFSPDGTLLATASWDKTAKLWNPATGALIATLIGHSAAIDYVRWSGDSAHVASGSRDGSIRLWNRKGELVATLECGGIVRDLTWNATNDRIVAGCGDSTVLFDVRMAMPVFRKQALGNGVPRVAFLPSGEILSFEADGTVRRWTPELDAHFEAKAHEGGMKHTDRCANDLILTVSDDHTAKLWSPQGEMKWRTPKELEVADASCVTGSQAIVVSTTKGKLLRFTDLAAAPAEVSTRPLPESAMIALSPDASRVAVVDEAHQAALIDLASGRATDGTAGTFKRTWEPKLVWAADGSAFVAVSDAGAVIWDGASAKRRFEVPPPGGLVRRILIDPSTDSLFVSAMTADVRRYSLGKGGLTTVYKNAAFPWGMSLIEGDLYVGFEDGTVVEYEVATGKLVRTVATLPADVYSVADAGNGLLWVGAGNRTLNLIDRETRAVIYAKRVPTEPVFLAARGLTVSMAGLTGMLAFITVDDRPADLARLEVEVRCRTTEVLRNGTLAQRTIDAASCAQQGL